MEDTTLSAMELSNIELRALIKTVHELTGENLYIGTMMPDNPKVLSLGVKFKMLDGIDKHIDCSVELDNKDDILYSIIEAIKRIIFRIQEM